MGLKRRRRSAIASLLLLLPRDCTDHHPQTALAVLLLLPGLYDMKPLCDVTRICVRWHACVRACVCVCVRMCGTFRIMGEIATENWSQIDRQIKSTRKNEAVAADVHVEVSWSRVRWGSRRDRRRLLVRGRGGGGGGSGVGQRTRLPEFILGACVLDDIGAATVEN